MIHLQIQIFAIALVAYGISLPIRIIIKWIQPLSMAHALFTCPFGTKMTHCWFFPRVKLLHANRAATNLACSLFLNNFIKNTIIVVN